MLVADRKINLPDHGFAEASGDPGEETVEGIVDLLGLERGLEKPTAKFGMEWWSNGVGAIMPSDP